MADKSFLSWPFFEDRHRRLAERLEAWAGGMVDNLPHGDLDRTCRALVTALGSAGFLAEAVPEAGTNAQGADALDVRSLCLVREILARHSALADFAFAMQGLGTGSITLFGTEAQRERYLPAVRAGHAIAAFALSEPDAGSDVAAMTMAATRVAGGWRLDGLKTWISNGGIADHYVVFARVDGVPGTKGIAAFVVDARTPGLEIAERIEVIAPHPLATLRFDGCVVPDTALLGQPGEGFKIAMATLDVFRPTVGAAALGMARCALDEAVARAKTRIIGGKPLAEQQLIQAKFADMALEIDAAALLVYRAAWTRDVRRQRITREAAMAKLYATEAAQRVIDEAVQIFGGLGVKQGVKVEELYREIRALRIYEGASEVQKLIIARQILQGQTLQEVAP
ncbi:acyl-CoA dehydrogenase [Aliidongia dinghuensis]|uniref:Acyl-CoA dehydrogenase n=1 Tax=Aliidongia dinghuensis TaxID=1867774 RepID=A0A8J2YZ78_9PROT|nr:acyl-CoA dehydrogenase family protein [Aliidongia dinghuensis]GGF36350.1 acyl-CoA dehydrogenase [Aliidongia dinghuensis]